MLAAGAARGASERRKIDGGIDTLADILATDQQLGLVHWQSDALAVGHRQASLRDDLRLRHGGELRLEALKVRTRLLMEVGDAILLRFQALHLLLLARGLLHLGDNALLALHHLLEILQFGLLLGQTGAVVDQT